MVEWCPWATYRLSVQQDLICYCFYNKKYSLCLQSSLQEEIARLSQEVDDERRAASHQRANVVTLVKSHSQSATRLGKFHSLTIRQYTVLVLVTCTKFFRGSFMPVYSRWSVAFQAKCSVHHH